MKDFPQHEASVQRLAEIPILYYTEFSMKDHMHTKKQENMAHSKEKLNINIPEQIDLRLTRQRLENNYLKYTQDRKH